MSISDSDSDSSRSSNSSSGSDSSKENVNTEQRPTAPAVPVRDPQPTVDETAAYDDDAGDITSAVQLKACFFDACIFTQSSISTIFDTGYQTSDWQVTIANIFIITTK